ncbi:MAG: high-potential iron-sulfur protein [Pseudomonadales bacterium]|nr:high-potential iron-sulfur protein [Pseudomonadales bacterium]
MPTRRNFLKTTAGLALIPLVNLPVTARAAEKVTEDDPTAMAMKYHHDATAAPRADKSGTAAADQFCHNCQFYTAADEGWGGCALFQNRLVAAEGWCIGWVPKAG